MKRSRSKSSPLSKPLSCQRCRLRKVKCDAQFPCLSCTQANVECIRTSNDLRKKRPAVNYVNNLESKIQNLTAFMRKFKDSSSENQKQLLVQFEELIKNNQVDADVEFKPETTEDLASNSTNSADEEHIEDRAIYGPTSVYDDNLIKKNATYMKRVEESTIKSLNTNPDILHCVKLFFTWQYPDHNMFIFREAFLIDFFDPKPNSLYCSKELILSICALGSKMSDDEKIYDKSIQFYNEAKSMLLAKLNNPSITSLQSYLLLAFYDISNGFNSSGWMLSGCAMRMGFDLGFQLNPEVWFVKSKEHLDPLDVDIRSRIYWGSYVADHFISLLLGRPSLLKITDASIPETNDLPDLEWIDEFTYRGYIKKTQMSKAPVQEAEQSYISNPLNKIINLINISDNVLNDIFTKSDLENDQSNHEDLNLTSRLEKLNEYNTQIRKWKQSLPPDLQWNRSSLQQTAENPTLTCIRLYYYLLTLCLNRPFVGIVKKRESTNCANSHDSTHLSPLKICNEAIGDLYEAIHRFIKVHGFRRVSIFMVYCSILSISIILLTNTTSQLIDKNRERLQFFMEVLQGSSKTWKLAEKSYNMISLKLKTHYKELDLEDKAEPATESQLVQPLLRPHANSPAFSMPSPNYKNVTFNHQSPSSFERLSVTPLAIKMEPDDGSSLSPSTSQSYSRPSDHIQSQNHQILTNNLETPVHSERALSEFPDRTNSPSTKSVVDKNAELLFDKNLDFLGGPPVLMTSDLFNEDWEALFPDYMFNSNN